MLFRFDNYLASSPNFIPVVHSIWRNQVVGTSMYSVTRKLKALKPLFRQQHKKKGDLSQNVKQAKDFLDIAENLLNIDRHNTLLLRLEHCCRLVYLKAVKLEHDIPITNSNEVVAEFIAFYEQLLGGTRSSRTLDLTQYRPWATRILSHEDGVRLTHPVSIEEIKLAFFDIAEDKSPGPDGYTAVFSKAVWPIVGGEITRAIMDFFSHGRLFKQELFTGYNQQHLPKCCALKVDLRKAYDTVEWDFLFETMRLFGFPDVFIQWVKECVTTPTFSVCINGSAHGLLKALLIGNTSACEILGFLGIRWLALTGHQGDGWVNTLLMLVTGAYWLHNLPRAARMKSPTIPGH
ncbi:UNVERIFIED_CONTAM: hypothetical protein Slati_0490400 [Sesamum latifolium]|uniref:Reverse transcriptase domain-containing protein n=1 Tax=Sesamum latifolium TaxID=2727402 RepID=A0AAW2XX92_9LAMI